MTRNIVISMILAASALAMPAHAAAPVVLDGPKVERSVDAVQLVQRQINASEAKRTARASVPGGKVVDISRRGDIYVVLVLDKSGRVVPVRVNANTGRVVR